MKIYLANSLQKGNIGGGWTFLDNLRKVIAPIIEDDYQESDIYFIASATMVSREEVIKAKADGKKIILRVDNVLRNSRNRGTGMTRMFDFTQLADKIVYQSQWARDFLSPYLKKDGIVIMNSADENIFKPDGPARPKQGNPQYLYVRSSRDEGKNWIAAWYFFQQEYFKNPKAHLWIHGHFSPDNEQWKFDFFGGAENKYSFRGFVETAEEMAEIYRSCDYLIYPFLFDACSNTLIEAILSDCKILWLGEPTGGAKNIKKMWEEKGKEYFYLKRMGEEYLELFNNLLN